MSETFNSFRFRAIAIYHNCHSAAAFNRHDAELEDDKTESLALLRSAQAYERIACQLGCMVKDMEQAADGEGERE